MNDTTPTQVIIPMAGAGSRFSDAGYRVPKPFLPLTDGSGNTLVEQVVEDVISAVGAGGVDRIIFLYRAEHTDFLVRSRLNRPDVSCVFIPIFGTTAGAACTVLQALPFVDPDLPLLVANSDQIFGLTNGGEFQIPKIVNQVAVTFKTGKNDPDLNRWSYLTKECSIVEKPAAPPTNNATAGIYWFRKASSLWDGIYAMIDDDFRVNGEYYLAPALNYTGFKTFSVPSSVFIPLGTPKDYETYVDMCLRMRTGTEENAA